jgi:hypothetical protein
LAGPCGFSHRQKKDARMQKICVRTLNDEPDLILQKHILRIEITRTEPLAESESKSALP